MDIIIYLIIGVAALAVGVIATVVVQKAFAKIGKPATTTKPEEQHDEHHHEH